MEHPDIRGLERWRPLAQGRHAAVWEARQPALDRSVAVKVYAGPVEEDARLAFLRVTARAAQLAGHPGVVTVHDAGVLPDGRPYVVEALATGGSVADWLEVPERRSEERVRRLGAVVADALATAHAGGIVHGSVGPANILVDGYDAPVLVDFGAAVVHAGRRDGTSASEPAYAPPEAPGGGAGAAGDVYSLAATLYALLTGGPPRRRAGQRGAVGSPGRGSALPLWDVDPDLRALLVSALDSDPTVRPSAAELRDGLQRPVSAGSSAGSSSTRDGGGGRTRRRVGVLVGAVALVVVGSAGAWLVGSPTSSSLQGPASSPTAARPDGPTAGVPTAGGSSPGGSGPTPREVRIQLEEPAGPAEPFEAVQLRGTHRGGAGSTFLRVQRWERGAWRAFPLPTRADRTGWFTTHVELGQPGRYRLRVVDPEAGVASEPVLLVVAEA